ncbi:hypothetical protein GF386_04040 [Candidatus Pacearchaeota archaeon]|nr:hypothetical protein [Candidatus Pacearchaeota archaeon]
MSKDNLKKSMKGGVDKLGIIASFEYKCERCDHRWIGRTKEIPITCPKCRSPYWNKPKKNENK